MLIRRRMRLHLLVFHCRLIDTNTAPLRVRRGLLLEGLAVNIEWWCGLASGLCGVGAVCLLLLTVDAVANGGRSSE